MPEQETQQTEEKKTEKSNLPEFKLFDKYDVSNIEIKDPGLKCAINLEPKLVAKSQGRHNEKMGQFKINIVERLINKIYVAGHRGKKQKIEVGFMTGRYKKCVRIVLEAFDMIEKQTKENPVQVFIRAIEKSSPRDEVTAIEYGGARYPQAVDSSPIRRVNLALRNISHGASDRAFSKKMSFPEGLKEEIIAADKESQESFAFSKKNEAEKQADSAR